MIIRSSEVYVVFRSIKQVLAQSHNTSNLFAKPQAVIIIVSTYTVYRNHRHGRLVKLGWFHFTILFIFLHIHMHTSVSIAG